ncbi:MAG: hypothetical protein Ta2E_06640 [Mycoplasmoidaceae bacterium]|nr:MAG: hypothetical protein Ta2E_06640 [Mycoplasmoidaceae bacterium]
MGSKKIIITLENGENKHKIFFRDETPSEIGFINLTEYDESSITRLFDTLTKMLFTSELCFEKSIKEGCDMFYVDVFNGYVDALKKEIDKIVESEQYKKFKE